MKIANGESNDKDKDTTYIIRRFLKIIRRNEGFPRKENSNKYSGENDPCHKCGKPGHFIKQCPLHKVQYKDYVNISEERKRMFRFLQVSIKELQLIK